MLCAKCKTDRAETEFYRSRKICKTCVKAQVRANYRANRVHYVEYEKKREMTPNRKASKDEAQRLHRARNPHKYRARTAVNNAIRDGRMIRLPCQDCGKQNSHAHHHDYNQPLDVEWLCKDCHWLRHGGVINHE